MLLRWVALLTLTGLLVGCTGSRRERAEPAPPAAMPAVPDTAPAAPAATPAVTVPPAGIPTDTPPDPERCHAEFLDGPPTLSLGVSGFYIPLPLASCRLTVPAGKLSLAFQVSNLEKSREITVTGATGRWVDGPSYRVDLDVKEGETQKVSFDLSAFHIDSPVRYTLVGGPPARAFLATAPDRSGPWTPDAGSGLIPPGQRWLRLSYPLAMRPDTPSPVSPQQYAPPGSFLPGIWEDERTQLIDLSDLPPLLWLTQRVQAADLLMYLPSPGLALRGDLPELQRITPADGSAHTVLRFDALPTQLALAGGAVRYATPSADSAQPEYHQVDPATGQVTDAPAPAAPAPPTLRFPSPDGRLLAELRFPDGPPTRPDEGKPHTADLVISEAATGKTVVRYDGWLSAWGAWGCGGNPAPGFGWRADSQAVAALDAPDADTLRLKVADLRGGSRTVAEQKERGAAYRQYGGEAAWAPSGRLLVFGSQLVDAGTGRVLADGLLQHAFWSADSRYLLLYQPDHPFTAQGAIRLLTVDSGQVRELGHGQALGWVRGEALILHWELGHQIPPPGKDC